MELIIRASELALRSSEHALQYRIESIKGTAARESHRVLHEGYVDSYTKLIASLKEQRPVRDTEHDEKYLEGMLDG